MTELETWLKSTRHVTDGMDFRKLHGICLQESIVGGTKGTKNWMRHADWLQSAVLFF